MKNICKLTLMFAAVMLFVSCGASKKVQQTTSDEQVSTSPAEQNAGEATSDSSKEVVSFQLVEKKPTFKGSDANEFSYWVNSRLIYPEVAKKEKISGRVLVTFTIDVDGSIKDVKVLRGTHPALDNEAVRVVSSSPKWKPGYQNGKPVPVSYTFPVIFMTR